MRRTISLLILAAVGLGGCASAQLQTPSGFAAHDAEGRTGYTYRASDGEGVVLAVRSQKNRPQGDLQYWTAVLDVKLRQAGYEARDRHDVQSADGHDGQQLRYVVEHQGRELSFWVTLFVTGRRVVIVEAGGDSELFSPKTDIVEKAIATLEIG